VGDDWYGNYGGANRINGRIYPNGQNGLKRDDIGPGDGNDNPRPKDCFDECYLEHDRCIADANDPSKTPCGYKDGAKKDCDLALFPCLVKCIVVPYGLDDDGRRVVKLETILKGWPLGALALPVIPILAHPGGWLPPSPPMPIGGPGTPSSGISVFTW
jgi:hypothetical protein